MRSPPLALAELATGGTIEVPVVGSSMVPTIRDGEWARVRPLDRSLRRGDVVLVGLERGALIHRVVAVGETIVALRGDNRPNAEFVRPARVLGLVTAARQPGGPWRSLEVGCWTGGLAIGSARVRSAIARCVYRVRHAT